MLLKIKTIGFALLLVLLSLNVSAGYEGVWKFTPTFYSITTNGFTQSWTLEEYLEQIGQFSGLTEADLTFEQQYDDSWLTPQTHSYNESGVTYSSTIRYTFTSDNTGTQTTEFTTSQSDSSVGGDFSSSGHLEYRMEKISSTGGSNTNNGSSNTTPTIADGISNVSVTSIQGSVFEITPTATTAVDNNITDNSTIFTSANASIQVNLGDSNLLSVAANTLVTLSPQVSIGNQNNKSASLLRGAVDYQISPGGSTEFQVDTPTVSVKVLSGNQRAAQQTNFNVQYSQSGNTGSSTIRVTSGSVQVTNRNGSTSTLTAGQEQTFNNQVTRTTWVQPADSAFLFGGKTNTLAWMSYPGAVGYIIEYTFPTPSFANENPAQMEFDNNKVVIPAANIQIIDDIVVSEMFLPESLNGQVVEARLFPVDALGRILNGSVASDRGTFGFKAQ